MDNFDLKKFLVENKLTQNSKNVNEFHPDLQDQELFKVNDVVQVLPDFSGEVGIFHGGWVPDEETIKFAGKIGRIISINPSEEYAYVNFPGDGRLYSFPLSALTPSDAQIPPYWGRSNMREADGSNSRYAEKIAQLIYDQDPALTDESSIIGTGHDIARTMMDRKTVRYYFGTNQDFPSDLITAYKDLQRSGSPNVSELSLLSVSGKLLREQLIKEDNLEVKKIAKEIYTFLKKNGVKTVFTAQTDKKITQLGDDRGRLEDGNYAQVGYRMENGQTVVHVFLYGNVPVVLEVEKKILFAFPNLQQANRSKERVGEGGKVFGLIFNLVEKTTRKGGLVGNTKTNQKPAPTNEGKKLSKLLK